MDHEHINAMGPGQSNEGRFRQLLDGLVVAGHPFVVVCSRRDINSTRGYVLDADIVWGDPHKEVLLSHFTRDDSGAYSTPPTVSFPQRPVPAEVLAGTEDGS